MWHRLEMGHTVCGPVPLSNGLWLVFNWGPSSWYVSGGPPVSALAVARGNVALPVDSQVGLSVVGPLVPLLAMAPIEPSGL